MPLYNYLCAECGPFDDIRSLGEYQAPAACPECGEPSPRQLGAPMIRCDSGEAGNSRPARTLRHGGNCGCCGSGAPRRSTAEAVAAAAPKRGAAKAPTGSFLTRA